MKLDLIRPYIVGPMKRVGSKNDGGYVIPKNLPDTKLLISFGLGDDWSFEKELLRQGGIDRFVFYDHTVSLRSLLSRTKSRAFTRNFFPMPFIYRVLVLVNYFIDFKVKRFPHIQKEVTLLGSDNSKTNLGEIAKSLNQLDFILKVDIEGSEYLLINQISELSMRIPLLIIEFHNVNRKREDFETSLNTLLEKYILCHAHANNFEPISLEGIPDAIELTFGRKDIYHGVEQPTSIPILGLDAPSARNRGDYTIKFL